MYTEKCLFMSVTTTAYNQTSQNYKTKKFHYNYVQHNQF